MTASTSKFTDRVLQNIKEANDKINEVDSSIENQIRSLIENNIFSKTATEKWKNFYEGYWSELEKEVSGPTHPFGREERQLKDDYFNDSLDNLTFDNENNKQNDLSDDDIKYEIKVLMEETATTWEGLMDYMSDDLMINNAEESKIYLEILKDYHLWKNDEDTDLNYFTEKFIHYEVWKRELDKLTISGNLNSDQNKDNKNKILDIVRNCGSTLYSADQNMLKDKEIVIEAIKNDTIAYKYLDKSLKNDPDILKLIKDD